jgi:hypothetical protein
MGFVVIGLLFLFALFFQQAQGGSAIAAGLRFMPLTAVFALAGAVLTAAFIPGKAPMSAASAGCRQRPRRWSSGRTPSPNQYASSRCG